MRHHIPKTSPSTPITPFLNPITRRNKRGSYNCSHCGLPKRGHTCSPAIAAATRPLKPQRALTFGEVELAAVADSAELDAATALVDLGPEDGLFDPDLGVGGGWRAGCVWEVMRRLDPTTLIASSGVCRGWREVAFRVWKAIYEIRIRVSRKDPVGFVGFVLKKCTNLLRISLTMESDLDATMLACIAFSCPNLESLEILMSGSSVNRVTGVELGRFVGDRRCLSNLKMEGCSTMGSLIISSASLTTLCLSDLHSLSKTIINCPNLREVSLDFTPQEDDTTDITSMADYLGRYCSRLQNIHIASPKISHSTVLALSSASLKLYKIFNLRCFHIFMGLRMLSLVLGSGITDASIAAIAHHFTKLDLLDLSGSSISDSGIGIICNVFSRTLTRLLLAVCPNVTSSGIQFATAQLPYLELLDCGMSISNPATDDVSGNKSIIPQSQKNSLSHHNYQKLIVKHSRLKKLSLWGCSGLDALYLNCPELRDLNLTSCQNLHPERIQLQCPNIETIHAANCEDMLHAVIETQVNNAPTESLLSKRMPDSSKRVRGPQMFFQPPSDDYEGRKRRCIVSTR